MDPNHDPKTQSQGANFVGSRSQRGITLSCKEVMAAGKYSEHKMYCKLPVKTKTGKPKILPVNGGKFYSKHIVGEGVDIMEFVHYKWIFGHEKVRTEDDGLVHCTFCKDRVNMMIKTAWSEFQRTNKVRIQFLCIVLDSNYTEPDDYLKNKLDVNPDIKDIIARYGEVFLAPIAVRSPSALIKGAQLSS